MGYKLWLTIALVIIIIIFLASIIEYVPPSAGEPGGLSLIWQRKIKLKLPCTGRLALSSQNTGDGKCTFQVDSVLYNCENERWYVFKGNECGGTLVCDGDVLVQESKWRCSWEEGPGTYTLTLCTGANVKASNTVTCY
jgi:hypothetical protein